MVPVGGIGLTRLLLCSYPRMLCEKAASELLLIIVTYRHNSGHTRTKCTRYIIKIKIHSSCKIQDFVQM